jgi:MFS family permease
VTLARAAGPEQLGRVLGPVGLIGQLAPVTGPVLGGLLVDGWGWRWAFLTTVPPVLVALAMTGRWFPRDAERSTQPLDVAGLVLLPGGLVALLYALSGGTSSSGSVQRSAPRSWPPSWRRPASGPRWP